MFQTTNQTSYSSHCWLFRQGERKRSRLSAVKERWRFVEDLVKEAPEAETMGKSRLRIKAILGWLSPYRWMGVALPRESRFSSSYLTKKWIKSTSINLPERVCIIYIWLCKYSDSRWFKYSAPAFRSISTFRCTDPWLAKETQQSPFYKRCCINVMGSKTPLAPLEPTTRAWKSTPSQWLWLFFFWANKQDIPSGYST